MSDKLKMPTLRFKEFSGEWEEKKLGNYGELINGLTYSPNDIVENGLLVLRSSNIQNGQISFKDNVYVNLNVEDKYLTRENDILICVRNGSKRLIGKNIIINNQLPKSTHGAFMTVFRGKSNKFIIHWFQSKLFYKQVHINLGATINSINGSNLKKFKTIFPKIHEQEKIASFLSSIDKKIEQLSKKDELLHSYKKGAMQKIFSQEIRFKKEDGSNYSDWEIQRLDNIIDFKSGYAFKSQNMSSSRKKFQLIKMSNIYKNKLTLDRNPSYLNEVNKLEKEFILETGDVVLTLTGTVGKKDYGYSSRILENGKFLLNQRLVRLREINNKSNSLFIYYIVLSERFLYYFFSNSKGGTGNQSNVSTEDIKSIRLLLPLVEEQTKIANFLSSIDTKISQNTKALEETKKFKKALLQQMFV